MMLNSELSTKLYMYYQKFLTIHGMQNFSIYLEPSFPILKLVHLPVDACLNPREMTLSQLQFQHVLVHSMQHHNLNFFIEEKGLSYLKKLKLEFSKLKK